MKAIAVIGATFGDEGKGLMVDYFCRQAQERPVVVRYNGGAQAGHTVVTPEGQRHVFHHFGAGTLAGADTYLSEYFLVNPTMWLVEARKLAGNNASRIPRVHVHRKAKVTTIYDMLANQRIEEARSNRHGSCGMGIHETMLRSDDPNAQLLAVDLCEYDKLKDRLRAVRDFVSQRLSDACILDKGIENFLCNENTLAQCFMDCKAFAMANSFTDDTHLKDYSDVIFEGAQGLLLDQENKRFFPHVTHSRTGLPNVIDICQRAGIQDLDVCYVARSYLTRHGAGELPGEDPKLSYADDTNQPNEWQGSLRFAPQDWSVVHDAIRDDFNSNCEHVNLDHCIAITHLDQCAELTNNFYDIKISVKYESFGPTYKDIIKRESIFEETQLESHSLRRA